MQKKGAKMTSYSGFAYMYDALMSDVPYRDWVKYIDEVLGGEGKTVVDLACGTGVITHLLADKGYEMIGIDKSVDMLSQAQAKGNSVLFLCQDMRKLDLYGTVDAVICTCDGMNYILKESELEVVFRRVKMFLNPGGVFIFDMNTPHKYNEILGKKSFVGEAEGESYVWHNDFDPETEINKYTVIFNPKKSTSFEEVHFQRAYSIDDVCNLLKTTGFNVVNIRNGYTDEMPRDDSSRVVFVVS